MARGGVGVWGGGDNGGSDRETHQESLLLKSTEEKRQRRELLLSVPRSHLDADRVIIATMVISLH